MKITPITPTATANFNSRRRPPHPIYGCEIDDIYRYRTTTDYTGGVTILDRRYGFRVYVPAEEAPRELQDGESSQKERAAYFYPGCTITNASGIVGRLLENGWFEPAFGRPSE